MLTNADQRWLSARRLRQDQSAGDRLGDLQAQLQDTQAKVDALGVAVKVLEDRPVPPR